MRGSQTPGGTQLPSFPAQAPLPGISTQQTSTQILVAGPEINPLSYSQLAPNKRGKNIRRSQDSLFSRWFWESLAAAAAKSLQFHPTVCDPTDGSPPGSPVPGTLPARILEWVAIIYYSSSKFKLPWNLLQIWVLQCFVWNNAKCMLRPLQWWA